MFKHLTTETTSLIRGRENQSRTDGGGTRGSSIRTRTDPEIIAHELGSVPSCPPSSYSFVSHNSTSFTIMSHSAFPSHCCEHWLRSIIVLWPGWVLGQMEHLSIECGMHLQEQHHAHCLPKSYQKQRCCQQLATFPKQTQRSERNSPR